MKALLPLFLTSSVLLSCQLQPLVQPQPLSGNAVLFKSLSQDFNTFGAELKLDPKLRGELALPDEEVEPREETYSESIVDKTIGHLHIKAHSYYFTFLDQGKSSVAHILEHDGFHYSAQLVEHWRDTLGENAIWPDDHSTSYQGPWPALEHGEYNTRGNGWFWFRSGSSKAEEYYQRAISAWRHDLPPNHPEQAEAWRWLGRTTHFVQDITVPFHTKSLVRPAQWFFHNPYEKEAGDRFHEYLPSKNNNHHNVWEEGPYPPQRRWGIYFPQRASAGDMVRFGAAISQPFYKLVNERKNAKNGNWDKTLAVLVPVGAKITAGLVQAFIDDLGLKAPDTQEPAQN